MTFFAKQPLGSRGKARFQKDRSWLKIVGNAGSAALAEIGVAGPEASLCHHLTATLTVDLRSRLKVAKHAIA